MLELELLIRAVLVGLAGWRVSSLLVQEDGPFDVFMRIRLLAGIDDTEATQKPGGLRGFSYAIFSCVWCMSAWLVPAAWALYEVAPIAVAIGAAMAVAMLAQQQASR